METRLLTDKSFREDFEFHLDEFALLYNESESKFMKAFMNVPSDILEEIVNMRVNLKELERTSLEDTSEYASEILNYYETSYNKLTKIKKPIVIKRIYETFTLRNPNDLIVFEDFLDNLVELLDVSPAKFVEAFPKCPVVFWDKIDDLRETSHKEDRDSEEYTRCLNKCKRLSFAFSDLSNSYE
jgi:hypothetical protein